MSTQVREPGARDSRAEPGVSSRAVAGSAALVLSGIVSTQVGAGLAARLFHQAPAAAVTGLRLWAAAIVLLIVSARGVSAAVRGVARRRAWRDALIVGGFGLCLGAMNFVFYQAIARIPLGVAVTIEFLGPLAVAVAGSRRRLDLVWVALAAAGVVLLTGDSTGHLNVAGIVFAGLSALGWAGYIMFSVATGRRFTGASGLALAMIVAAVVVTPVAAAAATPALGRLPVLLTGAGIGVLSSAIPYGLEMQALRRLPSRVFGIWMSIEPAVAALIGLLLLGQHLSLAEWAAVGCVVVASVGAARATPTTPTTSGAPASRDTSSGVARDCAGVSPTMGSVPAQPVPAASRRPALMRAWALISRPVLRPTRASLRGLALAAVVANVIIMSTGEAVRLSKSGLGCPDWPDCTGRSLVAAGTAGQTTLNTWIEFGNRLLNFPLVAIAGLTFIAACCYRPPGSRQRRRDLIWLAAALPGGVVGQAVVGGIVVLTKLNPAWVAIHFMLSTAIVAAAVVLHVRAGEGNGPAVPAVRRDLRIIGATLVGAVALTFAAGTVVTGTGPLAGNAAARRFHLPFIGVTQFHADIGWVIAALSFALLIGLPLSGAPRRAVRRIYLMAGLTLAQGAIGYAQYFSGLPAGLVWVHVTVAVVIWVVTVRLYLAMRDRGPLPAAPPPRAEIPEEVPATAPAPGA